MSNFSSSRNFLISDLQNKFDINSIFAHKILNNNKTNDFEFTKKLIDERPKPFVKWVGGKRQLLKQFRNLGLYPPEDFNPSTNTYFEPFVGGGAVFFDLLPDNAVISDLNFELVTTYKVIKDRVEELILLLCNYVYEKEFYLQIRAVNIKTLSDIEIAARFIYLNRTGFNGMYRVNKSGDFNVPFGRYDNPMICDKENLRRVSAVLQDATILHTDYKFLLNQAKPNDYIYFDPPYFPISKTSSFTSYTSNSFLEKEQIELRDTFKVLHSRGCFVMLSNSDTAFINKIYDGIKGVKITKITASRSINSKSSGRGKISEVLITNY